MAESALMRRSLSIVLSTESAITIIVAKEMGISLTTMTVFRAIALFWRSVVNELHVSLTTC